MFANKSNMFFIGLLVALWCIMLIISNPLGNFPLNDDFMYARTVHYLVDEGKYHITDEYSPVLEAQVYWGALFCLPFGFSFMALRVSVLVLGLLGLLFLYLLLHKLSGNKTLSFFCTALIACNPLFYCLANSFMSDVPFLSFSIIAIYCFVSALEKPTILMFVLATAAAILSTLTRQFGVILPVAFAIAGLTYRAQGALVRFASLVPLVAAGWLLHFAMGRLMGKGYYPYSGADVNSFMEFGQLTVNLFARAGSILYYSGFCLLPFLLVRGNPFQGLSAGQKRVVGVLTLVFVPVLVIAFSHQPVGNVLNVGYLGPFTIKGVDESRVLLPGLLTCIRCIAFAGAVLLLLNLFAVVLTLVQNFKNSHDTTYIQQKAFILFCLLGYGALSCVPGFFFDRYILYFFPLFIMLLIPKESYTVGVKRPVKAVAYAFAFMLALYAVAGTHDYLSWNRVRWQAGDYLTKDLNISPHSIDGGYEFNGWLIGKWYPLQANKSWWYVDDDEYVISTEPQQGYQQIKAFTYARYLPFGSGSVYIWHRAAKK